MANPLSRLTLLSVKLPSTLSAAVQNAQAPSGSGTDSQSQGSSTSSSSLLKSKSTVVRVLASWGAGKPSGTVEKGYKLNRSKYDLVKCSGDGALAKKSTGSGIVLRDSGIVVLGKADKNGSLKDGSTTRVFLEDGTKVKGTVRGGSLNGKGYVQTQSGVKLTGSFTDGKFMPDGKQSKAAQAFLAGVDLSDGEVVDITTGVRSSSPSPTTSGGPVAGLYAAVQKGKKEQTLPESAYADIDHGQGKTGKTGKGTPPRSTTPTQTTTTLYSDVATTTGGATGGSQPSTSKGATGGASSSSTAPTPAPRKGASSQPPATSAGESKAPDPMRGSKPGPDKPALAPKPGPSGPGQNVLALYKGVTSGATGGPLTKEEAEQLKEAVEAIVTDPKLSLNSGNIEGRFFPANGKGPTGKEHRTFSPGQPGYKYAGERVSRPVPGQPNKLLRSPNGLGILYSDRVLDLFAVGVFDESCNLQGPGMMSLGEGVVVRGIFKNNKILDGTGTVHSDGKAYDANDLDVDLKNGTIISKNPVKEQKTGIPFIMQNNGKGFYPDVSEQSTDI